MTLRAPLITRIERPRPPLHEVTGPTRLTTLLKGQDKQFAGSGQWKSYDWPNPTLRADSRYLASYLRPREGSPLNIALLKGQDKQFGGFGQWKTYDYPNPRGYEYPVSLRTWTDLLKLNLRGQDKQFADFGQWKSYDYPNPQIPRRPVDLLTWIESGNALTTGTVQSPFNQRDWPNPKGYTRNELLGWFKSGNSLFVPVQFPLNQRDWPNPRGYEFGIQLRTFAQGFTMLDLIPPAVIIIPPVVQPPVPPGGTSHKKRFRRLKRLKERKIPDPKEVIVELTEPVEHQTLQQVLLEMERAGFDIQEQEEEDDALVLTFILKTLQ